VVIQAIALEWKWLFIYPEEGVASVNYLQMPVGTPVRFDITADAPMNAFWIPSLGGQMYAMTGMTNRLNLMAEEEGQYEGRSSNYSGDGFAKMQFTAEAVAPEEYEAWVQEASADPDILSFTEYQTLAEPSTENPVEYYGEVEANLYDKITGQFMDHAMEKFHFPAH
jgi:cytochrome o ubiquinol oxidase subunit 2